MAVTERGTVEIDGGSLVYESAGEGPAVVLSHGGLVDRHVWDDLFPRLARRYRAVRYDVRGHGASSTRPGAYALHEDLRGLLDALEIDRAHLVGLSMGGELSLDLALAHPERVDRMVLIGSALSGYTPTDAAERRRVAALDAAVRSAYERGELDEAVRRLHATWTVGVGRTEEDLREGVLAAAEAMTRRNFDRPLSETEFTEVTLDPPAARRLPSLRAPTLILVGVHDVPYIQEIARRIEQEVPGARRVVVDGAAHHLPLDRPEELARLVEEFLDRAAPVGSGRSVRGS